ncbi:MAG: hypothetical protein ACREOB_05000, partial [Thermodesulfobacteriota bacterium]
AQTGLSGNMAQGHLNSNGNGYTIGEKVIHPSFGKGVVKRIEGIGDEAKVVISFPNHGQKKIIASFLGLKKT